MPNKEHNHIVNLETTSPRVASIAAKGLATGKIPVKQTRSVSGSALTQTDSMPMTALERVMVRALLRWWRTPPDQRTDTMEGVINRALYSHTLAALAKVLGRRPEETPKTSIWNTILPYKGK